MSTMGSGEKAMPVGGEETLKQVKSILERVQPEDRRQFYLHLVDDERKGSPELAKLIAAREEAVRAAAFHEVLSKLPRTRETVTAHKHAADELDHACSRYSLALAGYRDLKNDDFKDEVSP
jgi:hypothetical protein